MIKPANKEMSMDTEAKAKPLYGRSKSKTSANDSKTKTPKVSPKPFARPFISPNMNSKDITKMYSRGKKY